MNSEEIENKTDFSVRETFEICCPNKPVYEVYVKEQPKKCSKCNGKGNRGWNATRNFPVVCNCVQKVFVSLKEIKK